MVEDAPRRGAGGVRDVRDVPVLAGHSPVRVPCRFCGRPATLRFETRDWNRRLSAEAFRYYRCSGCAVTFLSPVPGDLGRYYPADYYPMPATLADLARVAGPERYKLDLVQRYRPGGRLLEIGPATGAFAYLAKAAGFEVDTVEIDAACCRFLREVVGVGAIESGTPSRVIPGLELYDVMALWHVIEHIPDPWETLAAAAGRLRPGGIVVIGAPNPDAFQLRVFGRYWTHLDAPRHLQLLPIETLTHRARLLGLRPLLQTTRTPGDLGWNLFGWQQSMENVVEANRPHPALPRRGRGSVASAIGWWLSLAALPVDRAGRLGSTYTVVLQKVAP
jgi:SAM-dependent methyltransferase